MPNGNQALSVLLDEVDDLVRKEDQLDFSQCPVGFELPKGMFLMLKLQRAQLKQTQRSILGLGGFGALGGGLIVGIVEAVKFLT